MRNRRYMCSAANDCIYGPSADIFSADLLSTCAIIYEHSAGRACELPSRYNGAIRWNLPARVKLVLLHGNNIFLRIINNLFSSDDLFRASQLPSGYNGAIRWNLSTRVKLFFLNRHDLFFWKH